jgi:hypothetical protein
VIHLEAGSVRRRRDARSKFQPQRLKLNTVGGEVTYVGPLSRGGHYSFQTISGQVRLLLPANSSFRLKGTLGTGGELSGDFNIASRKLQTTVRCEVLTQLSAKAMHRLTSTSSSGEIQIKKH